ncbi:MAG: AAA family ATPase [Pirellulaceae bacterium]|nr:AAA family ATPase [Pirellulaceae bacterium]MDG2103180.1 AAA family ATPase [Pirellulaceae bacterium]
MSELRLAICDPSEDSRERLKHLVMGIERACLEADCSRYEFFFDVVKTTEPEVCLVNIDHDVEIATALITQLNRNFPQTGIIAISSSTEGALILQIMRAGAREFLRAPVDAQELVSSLERVAVNSDPSKRPKSGKIIAIAGASGGVGTTSVSVNLACCMAQVPDESVALIDLDLSLGDADVFLDAIPEYTLLDVAQNVERLDLSLLRKSLTKHDSGVYLLPRPVQLQDIDEISQSNFGRVLKLLKASFTHLIVDLSKSYNSLDIRTLRAADEVLLLTQLDLPCLRNVVRLLTSLEAMEGITDKIKIVVNRTGLESGQISLKKAEAHIGREIFWQVPNNFSAVSEGRNNGVPLLYSAPNAAITQNIISLADHLIDRQSNGDEVKSDKKERKGLFGFLSKG